MRSVPGVLVLLLVATACGASGGERPVAGAPEPQGRIEQPVRAELLADAAAIRPGQKFQIGVRLTMRHGWHVYWKNPGDSGLPVAFEPSGPDGVVFGAAQWPLPIEFTQPGDIAGFGYTDSVLFPIDVTAPASAVAGGTIHLAVKTSWLACRDVCIPGSATAELDLPVAAASAAANTDVFEAWRAKLPATGDAADVETTGAIGDGQITMRIRWKEPVRAVAFFPVPESALNVANIRVEHTDRQTTIRFDATVLSGQKLMSDELEALVVATDAHGARRGIQVPVRLRGAPGPESR